MSSFLAFSDLTCPLSCLRANEIPPVGATDCCALIFLPSYMLPPDLVCADWAAPEEVGTEIAWNVACGRGSLVVLAYVSVGLPTCSKRLFCRPLICVGGFTASIDAC